MFVANDDMLASVQRLLYLDPAAAAGDIENDDFEFRPIGVDEDG